MLVPAPACAACQAAPSRAATPSGLLCPGRYAYQHPSHPPRRNLSRKSAPSASAAPTVSTVPTTLNATSTCLPATSPAASSATCPHIMPTSSISDVVADRDARFSAADLQFMAAALDEARAAAALGEVPVGAVLVHGGRVLARAHNRVHTLCSPLAHAEILCLAAGASRLRAWRLLGATLYVTLEPCPMCAGAILQARLARVVYGARQPRLGADGSWVQLFPASSTAAGGGTSERADGSSSGGSSSDRRKSRSGGGENGCSCEICMGGSSSSSSGGSLTGTIASSSSSSFTSGSDSSERGGRALQTDVECEVRPAPPVDDEAPGLVGAHRPQPGGASGPASAAHAVPGVGEGSPEPAAGPAGHPRREGRVVFGADRGNYRDISMSTAGLKVAAEVTWAEAEAACPGNSCGHAAPHGSALFEFGEDRGRLDSAGGNEGEVYSSMEADWSSGEEGADPGGGPSVGSTAEGEASGATGAVRARAHTGVVEDPGERMKASAPFHGEQEVCTSLRCQVARAPLPGNPSQPPPSTWTAAALRVDRRHGVGGRGGGARSTATVETPRPHPFHSSLEVVGGCRAAEAAELMRAFFRRRRRERQAGGVGRPEPGCADLSPPPPDLGKPPGIGPRPPAL